MCYSGGPIANGGACGTPILAVCKNECLPVTPFPSQPTPHSYHATIASNVLTLNYDASAVCTGPVNTPTTCAIAGSVHICKIFEDSGNNLPGVSGQRWTTVYNTNGISVHFD